MSNRNEKNAEQRRESRQKRLYRLISLILVILLVGSGFVSVAVYIIYSVSAADIDENSGDETYVAERYVEPEDTEDTANTENTENTEKKTEPGPVTTDINDYDADAAFDSVCGDSTKIAVGLMYGADVTVGFETTATHGYTLGKQYLDGTRDFVPLWLLNTNVVSVTCDYNLSKSYMTYSLTSSLSAVVIGGYHLETQYSTPSSAEAASFYSQITTLLDGTGLYAFPVYFNDTFRVRIGAYSSAEAANSDMQRVVSAIGYACDVVTPTNTALSVLDPYTDTILFEYDCEDASNLGLQAYSPDGSDVYIKTPAANIYAGVFTYKRYSTASVIGTSVVNVVSLEEYVASVLPYEISNSWPAETLKAFAVTVRSYTVSNIKRHSQTYGFDLCNNQHCQVYKGFARVNDKVKRAVAETAGMVLSYDGTICVTYYSSSTGGSTVNSGDAWGGANKDYLVGKTTPWEDYLNCNNGFWTVEISPSELATYLHNTKNYTSLYSSVASVSIDELCDGSSYVYALNITDVYGNTVRISRSDNIRTTLGKYLNSANFVIGKGSVDYTVNIVNKPEGAVSGDTSAEAQDKEYGLTDLGAFGIYTKNGKESASIDLSLDIFTGNGESSYSRSAAFVMTKENAAAFLNGDTATAQNEIAVSGKREINYTTETRTAYASNSDNFIIVGKGWGHGVGMSQYGARDLADFGYSYEDILHAYFNDTQIDNYKNYME